MTSLQRRFNARIEIVSLDAAGAIYSALKPDIKSSPDKQASADIALNDDMVSIDISSNDLSHLRASLNSFLRLVRAASSCLDTAAV
jgi:tRNA threonylcarbamoyladenosine modification (KEOPS) complex  Pcc1 subunit